MVPLSRLSALLCAAFHAVLQRIGVIGSVTVLVQNRLVVLAFCTLRKLRRGALQAKNVARKNSFEKQKWGTSQRESGLVYL